MAKLDVIMWTVVGLCAGYIVAHIAIAISRGWLP